MRNSSPPPATPAPAWAFLFRHPAHMLGLGLGTGLAPKAPGTVGTLGGWVLFLPLQMLLPTWAQGALVSAAIAIGWWICTISARNLGRPDPGCIVWDEIAAFWLVLWLLTPSATAALFAASHWCWQVAAFVLFRCFDAAKPGPVGWADRIFKGSGWRGGWGIMFDDLLAAFCTLLTLALARHVWLLILAWQYQNT